MFASRAVFLPALSLLTLGGLLATAACGDEPVPEPAEERPPEPRLYVLVNTPLQAGCDFDEVLIEGGQALATRFDGRACEAPEPDLELARVALDPDGSAAADLPSFENGDGGPGSGALLDFELGARLLSLPPEAAPLQFRVQLCLSGQRVNARLLQVAEDAEKVRSMAEDNQGEFNVSIRVTAPVVDPGDPSAPFTGCS